MAVAFALVLVTVGAALVWLGWRGKSLSDLYGLIGSAFGKGTA